MEQLPAMPHSALTVLQLDNDLSNIDINDIVRPIEADPGLSAQVLKFLNSSYFGFQSAISNVRQGIALVGIRIVKNFVLWKAVFSLIPKSKMGSFDVAFLWQDSLRRAMFARFLLLEIRKGDAELAFAAALLQDMAIPLLLKQIPNEYSSVLKDMVDTHSTRLSQLENEAFGWNHADAAGVIGKNWNLPPMLTKVMSNHLLLEESMADIAENPEQAVVSLSALLPMVSQDSWEERELFTKHYNKVLGDKPLPIDYFFAKVDKEFDQYALVLQIAKPRKLLASFVS
ncbi:MAG: HDOD domain-containing protein [Thermoguttaceae bacterium]